MEYTGPKQSDHEPVESDHEWEQINTYLDYNWARYRAYLYIAAIARLSVLTLLLLAVGIMGRARDDEVLIWMAIGLLLGIALELLAALATARQIAFYRQHSRL